MINVKKNKTLYLRDIINLDEEFIENIQALIQKELKTDEELSTFIMEELLEEALRKPDELRWLIDEQTLIIYFDEYEIAAGAAEVVEVNIPFEKLRPYLSARILEEWPELEKKESKKEAIKQKKGIRSRREIYRAYFLRWTKS